MRSLYTLFVQLYSLAIRLASPWNHQAKRWIEGRKNIMRRLAASADGTAPWIWFHAASLGEFEQGRPLMEAIRHKHPTIKILLTFFSPSGYEVQKNYPYADLISYLPSDTLKNATALCQLFGFKAVFFIKYEFWFNYLHAMQQAQIPLYFVSVRFRESQHFFKWYGGWFRKHLWAVNHFFVQDKTSVKLLNSIGINQVTLAGDTRFDRVATIAKQAKKFPDIENFMGGRKCILAGSTWPVDEHFLIPAFAQIPPDYCIIMAPHDVSASHVNQLMRQLPEDAQRYSQYNPHSKCSILVIDSIGILSQLYQYATFAYIGGGFGHAIHNIQEAITFGCPVIFGPKHQNFNEANDLTALGGAFAIKSGEQFAVVMNMLMHDKNARNKAANICSSYVAQQIGATETILQLIDSKL